MKIASTYNTNAINKLKSSLAEKNKLKEGRISVYLKSHPSEKLRIEINGKVYAIHDIIDGKPMYRTTHNINSAKATKTDQLYPGGGLGLNLEGENMSIGVWDEESVRGTHDEFKDDQPVPESRVIYPEFPGLFFGPISDHATHVAGTLLAKGVNADAKGMAPKATLRSYDWEFDDTEALDEASNGLLISNHSYGIPIFSGSTQQVDAEDIGSYSSAARTWDEVAYNVPFYLAVNSAGNAGSGPNGTYSGGLGPGYDKLTGNKTAKNNLVVANANPILNAATGELTILAINSGSSQGPTDDFRIKPDIAGDGTNVYSPFSGSDDAYSTISGTSMASPNVAGSLLLLQEYYNQLNSSYMRAATLKGLVCHTAIDDNTRTGPDAIFGWGLLNARDAVMLIKGDTDNNALIREVILNGGDTYTYQFSAAAGSELKATICWTDPAGNVSSSPNNVLSPRLINDLDLRLEDSNSTVFTPWKLDNTNVAAAAIKGDNNVDNIERIDIDNPVNGNYTLTVTHKGSLTNGSQPFSIILSGNNVTLSSKESALSGLQIWPIPASTSINIKYNTLPDISKLMLYNINGKLIYQDLLPVTSNGNYAVNTSKFSKGIYFLNITSGNSKFTKKIIIK
ncbi:S8 family serine peptidase [Hyunsoonleella flava]|nr:S8 family serine peptidase [Hyunsoonleella flava]